MGFNFSVITENKYLNALFLHCSRQDLPSYNVLTKGLICTMGGSNTRTNTVFCRCALEWLQHKRQIASEKGSGDSLQEPIQFKKQWNAPLQIPIN